MKSLKESLFDRALITGDIPIDTKTIHDMLLGRIYKMKKDIEKRGWGVHFFNDVIILSKDFYNDSDDIRYKISFVIYCAGGVFKNILVPTLTVGMKKSDELLRESRSDHHFLYREIKRRGIPGVEFLDIPGPKQFDCSTGNKTLKVIDLLKAMINNLTSEKISKVIQEQVDIASKQEKTIPGIIIDRVIMKKIINEI